MELLNRDEIEEDMLLALLLLWNAQRERFEDTPEFWRLKDSEDREWLLYWLGAVFAASSAQHGLPQADLGVGTWGVGHAIRVMSRFSQHSRELLQSKNPAENIFGENRARRFVTTELTSARAAGAEYAKLVLGQIDQNDLWFAANPVERRCPYCGRLHLQPRRLWKEIYYTKILPSNPEMAIYGEPNLQPVHPNCNCFTLYLGESYDDSDEAA